MEQVIEAERNAVAQTRSAYAAWESARDVIATAESGVSANRESTQGVRAENNVGTRTALDVLNAEQELLNSQVTLFTARRDAYVAGFALLAAMGKAEAKDLGFGGGALYDPLVNYDRVKNKISDWSRDPDPVLTSTSTFETPRQDAVIANAVTADQPAAPH
jgi:outer membrane protein